ncbi:MAG: extracellular solute-binding protein [Chloroflexi bacterium]|nr:extracellular solute-binding protein [Chloroflexota bacterium]
MGQHRHLAAAEDLREKIDGARGFVTTRRDVLMGGVALGIGGALAPTRSLAAAQADAPVELTIWLGGEPGTVNVYTELIDEYQQLHPNVTAEAVFIGSDLFNPSLVPALNAGEGPDIWMGGTGPGQPASFIQAGHVLDLTSYYCEYGWNEVIPETIVNVTSSEGKLWAVGDSVESTVMFYNKDIFAEHGLTVPTTWTEFIAICDALQAAGYPIVIGLGGSDRFPMAWWQSMLWGMAAGPEGLERVMFGDDRWDEEPFVDATARLAELNEAGYFGPNPLAEVQSDITARFWRGEIPMTFTGPWIIPAAVSDLGEDIQRFGIFRVPNPVEDAPIYPTESIGQGWYVNARTEAPDVAADLINYMLFREESRERLLESGDDVPVGPLDLEGIELPELLEEVLASVNEYRENGTVHAFINTVTPANMIDVSYDGLQSLMAGQITPEEFNAAVQAAWEEAKAEDLHLKPGGVSCPAD